MRKRTIALAALVGALGALVLVGALLGSSRGGVAPTATTTVDISGFQFVPRDITINVGDTVTWTNSDSVIHTATSTSGPASFDTGNIPSGQSRSVTFTVAGSYTYFCEIHPGMTGTVTVTTAIPEFPGTMAFLAAVLGTFALVGYAANRRRKGAS